MHIFHKYQVTAKRHYTPETLCRGYLDLSKESRRQLIDTAPFDYSLAMHDGGVIFKIEKCVKCPKTRETWTVVKC